MTDFVSAYNEYLSGMADADAMCREVSAALLYSAGYMLDGECVYVVTIQHQDCRTASEGAGLTVAEACAAALALPEDPCRRCGSTTHLWWEAATGWWVCAKCVDAMFMAWRLRFIRAPTTSRHPACCQSTALPVSLRG